MSDAIQTTKPENRPDPESAWNAGDPLHKVGPLDNRPDPDSARRAATALSNEAISALMEASGKLRDIPKTAENPPRDTDDLKKSSPKDTTTQSRDIKHERETTGVEGRSSFHATQIKSGQDGIMKLETGDTLVKDGVRETLFMPNGDKLTVTDKNGSVEVKSTGTVKIDRKDAEHTAVTFANGDKVLVSKSCGIVEVARGGNLVELRPVSNK
jgi:hypothetical protein